MRDDALDSDGIRPAFRLSPRMPSKAGEHLLFNGIKYSSLAPPLQRIRPCPTCWGLALTCVPCPHSGGRILSCSVLRQCQATSGVRPVGLVCAGRRDIGIARHANQLRLAGAKFRRIPFLACRSPFFVRARAAVRGGNGSDRGNPARWSLWGASTSGPCRSASHHVVGWVAVNGVFAIHLGRQ